LKNIALLIVGFGILPLAGCMSGTADSENVQSDEAAVLSCATQGGLFPTKAGLAVAMANELGRWDPVDDLAVVMNTVPYITYTVVLSPNAKCVRNNCANTRALLGQQTPALTSVVDQTVFSPQSYGSDLRASFDRQSSLISGLKQNHPTQLPPAHKLTEVAGPVNLGTGACGAHYVFQADHLDGTPLNSTEATNMANSLSFYGFGAQGGNNPFIAFTVAGPGQGCPPGRTCVAVDPTDSDNGSTATTTGQAAVTYPLNRLYNPTNTKLGTQCITTGNKAGTMVSKCTTMPTTCGYLYCVAS
jgi:hypothetical protein